MFFLRKVGLRSFSSSPGRCCLPTGEGLEIDGKMVDGLVRGGAVAYLFIATLCGETAARAHSVQPQPAKPRYEDRYLKAKAGINAVERRIRMRLQHEINSENQRLRAIAHVLSPKPLHSHRARAVRATLHNRAELARDSRKPAGTSGADAAKTRQSLARIVAKRKARLSQMQGDGRVAAVSHEPPEQHDASKQAAAAGKRSLPRAADTRLPSVGEHGRNVRSPPALKRHSQNVAPSFDMHTVRRFDPGQSLSFARELFATFALSYADTSLLTGYVGRDIVQLGHYYAMTRFGCALDCNDVHFNGIDGILGLGMPDAALSTIPTPLLFALANDRGGLEGQNYVNERAMHQRKFAFLSTAASGELQVIKQEGYVVSCVPYVISIYQYVYTHTHTQLGGYDRASTNADMVYVPTTSTTEYSVNVQSLTFGGIELLNWRDTSVPNAIPAILDTGTTCLVIPDSGGP